MKPSPTLRDIAKEADVSVATVSMALRNHARIADATKRRIHALAQAMGYVPDTHVAELMGYLRKGRRGLARETLAFVCKLPLRELLSDTIFRDQYQGARKRAIELGYRVEYHQVSRLMTQERLGQVLRNRGVRGILVLPQLDPEHKSRGLESLPWQYFASVAIGFSCELPQTHRVMADQIQSLHIAMQALQGLGYRRPGFVMERWSDDRLRNHWSAGYLSCQLRYYPAKEHVPPMMRPSDEPQLLAWFKRWRPDVIIGSNLAGPVRVLGKAGFRAPRDFGHATLNKHLEGHHAHHAGVYQMSDHVGEVAVNVLAGCLTRHEIGLPDYPQVILLPCRWVNGKTAPPRGNP